MSDLRDLLAMLKEPVRKGMKLQEANLPARFEAITGILEGLINGENIYKGTGVRVSRGAGGVKISSTQRPSYGGGNTDTLPWTPFLRDGATAGAYDVSFFYGTVNGLLPGNQTGATGLTWFAVPAGFTIWSVKATTNGRNVSALSIESGASPPAPQTATTPEAPPEFSAIIGATYLAGGEVKAEHILKSHLTATPEEGIRVPKASWGVGELAYNPYYIWSITES